MDGITSQDVPAAYNVGVSKSQPLSSVCSSLINSVIAFSQAHSIHSVQSANVVTLWSVGHVVNRGQTSEGAVWHMG